MKWWSILPAAASLLACGRIGYDPLPAASVCATEPAGFACDDGFACTDNDMCDATGICVGTANDTSCPVDSFCVPDCFGGSTGCGEAPTGLSLNCDPANGATADCAIEVAGNEIRSACLSCETRVGFVPLLRSDFEDEAGECSADGWQLASGTQCRDSAAACTSQGAVVECCDDFASICNTNFGGASLQSVVEENCGGDFEEWRASYAADASGLENLQLCYDASEAYAEAGEAIMAGVNDNNQSVQLDCVLGDTDWRGGFETRCAGLPPWANNNPALTLGFVVHNNTVHPQYPTEIRRMSLDNVSLYGNDPACTTTKRSVVFEEDFSGCTDPIPDGYNDWTITTGIPNCRAACTGQGPGLVAVNTDWVVQRSVDTSLLSGDVQLCMDVGHVNAPDVTEGVAVAVDLGDGSGFQLAGRGSLYRAADSACQEICFSLSAVDLEVAHNPNLGIQISARSTAPGRFTFIDNIHVSGVESCPGETFVDVGPISEAGAGRFALGLSNQRSQALTAQLTCTWDRVGQRRSASTMVPLGI